MNTDDKAKALPTILHTYYRNRITGELQPSDLILHCDIHHGGANIFYKPRKGGGDYMFCLCCGETLSEAIDIMYQRVQDLHLSETEAFVDEVRTNR